MKSKALTPEKFMARLLKAVEAHSGDQILDMEEAAKLLRISRKALNQRYREQKLPKRIPASTERKPLWRKRDLIGGEG